MDTQVKLKCDCCNNEFSRRLGEVNRNKKLDRKHFCCRSCQISYSNKHRENNGNVQNLLKGNKSDEYSPFRSHLKQARWHSKKKNRDVQITLEDLKNQWDKQNGICPYTGWKLINAPNTNSKMDKTPNRASLDRIDSSKGYTKDNIQFISMMAQFAKNGWNESELFNFCKAVVNNNSYKGYIMGVGVGYRERNPYTHSSSSYNYMCQSYQSQIDELKKQIAKNPDPSNFEVLDVAEYGDCVALKVKYPNCTNAEGIKIMVVRTSVIELLKTKVLDPHFGESSAILARFEPTDRGWLWAKAFSHFIVDGE